MGRAYYLRDAALHTESSPFVWPTLSQCGVHWAPRDGRGALTKVRAELAVIMRAQGFAVRAIARAIALSVPRVYQLINEEMRWRRRREEMMADEEAEHQQDLCRLAFLGHAAPHIDTMRFHVYSPPLGEQ